MFLWDESCRSEGFRKIDEWEEETMGMEVNLNDGPLPIDNVCEPHLPVLLLIDASDGLMSFAHNYIEELLNKFAAVNCKMPKVAESVDVCIMSFNDSVSILQDWGPISEMKNVKLSAGGGKNMSAALRIAVDEIKRRVHRYEDIGIEVRMPYLVIITDGKDDNIDEIAEEIRHRTDAKKLLPWFIGVHGYDKETAEKLTEGKRVFELYDFMDLFGVMEGDFRVLSTPAPDAKLVMKEDENPLIQAGCPDLSYWLT